MSHDPFKSNFSDRLKQASKTDNINAAANALFGPTVDKYSDSFQDVKQDLKEADMDVLFRTYMSKAFLFSCFAAFVGLLGGIVFSISSGFSLLTAIRFIVGVPLALALAIFGFMYIYPSQKAKSRKQDIDDNLPFALNHLGAIATSGIPPKSMFELLTTFDEYGGISDEAEEISRRVNVFGEDLTTALKEVAEKSPSEDWSEVLYGIISTVETGGDLESYINEKADEALFDYNMEREKEIEKLSTYASFYTAILIAAPVFLVVVLAVMNLLGGSIAGFAIRDLMWLGVHIIIPAINSLFVAFLALTVD
ncbi:MAG: type II secretion system F family protein [Nanohaloarchaea archaeon]|nr:type II secretion system F family protein [Candidatus Nanohaloarchaea archaeon]